MVERRKHNRYKVDGRAFAIHWSSPTTIGQIIDISQGGISFSYIDENRVLEDAKELGILYTEGNFFLEKITFERISDIAMDGHPKSTVKMRRLSGKFLSLGETQQEKLNKFINECSSPPPGYLADDIHPLSSS